MAVATPVVQAGAAPFEVEAFLELPEYLSQNPLNAPSLESTVFRRLPSNYYYAELLDRAAVSQGSAKSSDDLEAVTWSPPTAQSTPAKPFAEEQRQGSKDSVGRSSRVKFGDCLFATPDAFRVTSSTEKATTDGELGANGSMAGSPSRSLRKLNKPLASRFAKSQPRCALAEAEQGARGSKVREALARIITVAAPTP